MLQRQSNSPLLVLAEFMVKAVAYVTLLSGFWSPRPWTFIRPRDRNALLVCEAMFMKATTDTNKGQDTSIAKRLKQL